LTVFNRISEFLSNYGQILSNFFEKVVAMAKISKNRWLLRLKFFKKVVAMAERLSPKKGGRYG
jgi:hypothetical protein